ncbi:MAG: hypothetical protein FWC93_07925 [Defluviitaleaceae bacterium]|nr:hypothetical protein [Defluviitaleaceae bacterium]
MDSDSGIFKKMRVKDGMTMKALYSPPDYPKYNNAQDDKYDFVHLFVTSQKEFAERFATAADIVNTAGLFWLSYPKSAGKQKYDINRDSLWDLVLARGWHPVGQVALDDTWSAVRLKPNEPGIAYSRPANMKGGKN